MVRAVNARNGPSGSSRPGECQHDLPRRCRMRDRGSPEPRDGLDLVGAGNEVDRDRIVVARDGQRGRLTRGLDQRDQVWARDLAHVEACEDGVCEMHEPNARPILARCLHALDETGRRERAELAGDRARGHARSARDLVRAELTRFCKGVEHRDGPFGSADSAGGRLTSARHRCRFVADSGTALLKVQFSL